MTDYTHVALGFSEFVGQLLTETFEATLNAQQYQLSRYAELEAMADLPDDEFRLRYVDPQAILNREIAYAGAPIARQMEVPDSRQDLILELTEEYEAQSVIFKNRLTNYGFEALREVIDGQIVQEQKSQLRALLARMEQARLVVDSGEITARLTLNSVFQSPTSSDDAALPEGANVKSAALMSGTTDNTGDQQGTKSAAEDSGSETKANTKAMARMAIEPARLAAEAVLNSPKVPTDGSAIDGGSVDPAPKVPVDSAPIDSGSVTPEPKLPGSDTVSGTKERYDGIKMLEDPISKETTLLFDKEVLDKAVNSGSDAPVRITAKPVNSSATSAVFSEVTIRFKTV
ncbi:MAG: hypothetical protein VXZ05_10220 [Pseudomonadota bacterium]|nr:hypothetical protein [Pseudomonadota bacterium]